MRNGIPCMVDCDRCFAPDQNWVEAFAMHSDHCALWELVGEPDGLAFWDWMDLHLNESLIPAGAG